MDRPALQALMADIKAGNVDVIVVYKVDRLSRSLNDFAQMVNVFDAHQVSFVSITQQFNTTTSMGRLTLNILLSFAQFEREVISERVRDKVAASKQKGMWMGGYPPLGYTIDHRKLVPIEQEVALLREIFDKYIELQSTNKLATYLNNTGHTNKRWVNRHGVEIGGQKFTNQALSKILNNPIYIGRTRHKDKTYDGQHDAILPIEVWEKAQQLLKGGREKRTLRNVKHGTLLASKCFSAAGTPYSPTYTLKEKSIYYRYYLCKETSHRIKGKELEGLVFDVLRFLSNQPKHWQACWRSSDGGIMAEELQHRWRQLCNHWTELTAINQLEIAQQIIERIVVTEETLTVRLHYPGIIKVVASFEQAGWLGENDVSYAGFIPHITLLENCIEITVRAKFQTYGRSQMVLDEEGKPVRVFNKSSYNHTLVNALVKSYRWNRQLDSGQVTITELAKQQGRDRTYISRIVNLMMLAPDIISSILTGTQPATMHLKDLTANLPVEWHLQKQVLKF
ncbi:MAG: recombinase family protein [Alphaproteobacteria bacterium]